MREASQWGMAGVEQRDRVEKGEVEGVPGQKSKGLGGFVEKVREKDIGLGGEIWEAMSRIGET